MPSIVRSYAWFVRITKPHDQLKERFAQIATWVDLHSVLFIGHNANKAENAHGHMLVRLNSELQKQSLDVRIKSIFDVKGSDYSSKPWDLQDGAGGYMFHDIDYVMLGNKGFSVETIQRYQDLNKKTQEVIAVSKNKGNGRNVEAVLESFAGQAKPTRHEVAIAFLRRIKDGDMYEPGDFKLKAMVEEVMIKLCANESQFLDYAYVRIDKIFR